MAALQGALIALSEGRTGSAAGPDGAAGPDHGLTITRGRELAATVSELSAALEVKAVQVLVGAVVFLAGRGRASVGSGFVLDRPWRYKNTTEDTLRASKIHVPTLSPAIDHDKAARGWSAGFYAGVAVFLRACFFFSRFRGDARGRARAARARPHLALVSYCLWTGSTRGGSLAYSLVDAPLGTRRREGMQTQ